MLEPRQFRIAPAARWGFTLSDGETGCPVGTAASRGAPAAEWRDWLLGPRRARPEVLEVREPPDGSLVFALARDARGAELTDGQDHAVWRYRESPRGKFAAAARGKFEVAARLVEVGRGRYAVVGPGGATLASIELAGEAHVACAAELDGLPFDKMLVLGAALWLLTPGTRRRSQVP